MNVAIPEPTACSEASILDVGAARARVKQSRRIAEYERAEPRFVCRRSVGWSLLAVWLDCGCLVLEGPEPSLVRLRRGSVGSAFGSVICSTGCVQERETLSKVVSAYLQNPRFDEIRDASIQEMDAVLRNDIAACRHALGIIFIGSPGRALTEQQLAIQEKLKRMDASYEAPLRSH